MLLEIEKHFIMIKKSVHHEDVTTTNTRAEQRTKARDAKTNRTKETNKQFDNNNWRLQYPDFNNEQNSETEDQTGNRTLK